MVLQATAQLAGLRRHIQRQQQRLLLPAQALLPALHPPLLQELQLVPVRVCRKPQQQRRSALCGHWRACLHSHRCRPSTRLTSSASRVSWQRFTRGTATRRSRRGRRRQRRAHVSTSCRRSDCSDACLRTSWLLAVARSPTCFIVDVSLLAAGEEAALIACIHAANAACDRAGPPPSTMAAVVAAQRLMIDAVDEVLRRSDAIAPAGAARGRAGAAATGGPVAAGGYYRDAAAETPAMAAALDRGSVGGVVAAAAAATAAARAQPTVTGGGAVDHTAVVVDGASGTPVSPPALPMSPPASQTLPLLGAQSAASGGSTAAGSAAGAAGAAASSDAAAHHDGVGDPVADQPPVDEQAGAADGGDDDDGDGSDGDDGDGEPGGTLLAIHPTGSAHDRLVGHLLAETALLVLLVTVFAAVGSALEPMLCLYKAHESGVSTILWAVMMIAEYGSLVFLRTRVSITVFPRNMLIAWLLFYAYYLHAPLPFMSIASLLFFLAALSCLLGTVLTYELPAYATGRVSMECPRELGVVHAGMEAPWATPSWATLLQPLNARLRLASVYSAGGGAAGEAAAAAPPVAPLAPGQQLGGGGGGAAGAAQHNQ